MATSGGLVYHNTTQTINHDTATQFSLNTVSSDPDGYWQSATSIIVPTGKGGLHLFMGQTWTAGTVVSDIHLYFKVNNATVRLANRLYDSAGPDLGYMQVFAWLDLDDGDSVEFFGYVDNGGSSKTFGHASDLDAQTAVGWFKIT